MSEGDDNFVYRLVRETHESVQNLDHILRGNGGPGLAELVRKNERAIEDLKARIPEAADTSTARWKAIGHIAVAAVAITSLLLQLWSG